MAMIETKRAPRGFPNQAGFYYFQRDEAEPIEPVKVLYLGGVLCYLVCSDHDDGGRVSNTRGEQWYGPVIEVTPL